MEKMQKSKHIPMRMCISCRESRPKEELIRLNQSGKGLYVCNNPLCIARMQKNRSLNEEVRKRLAELG